MHGCFLQLSGYPPQLEQHGGVGHYAFLITWLLPREADNRLEPRFSLNFLSSVHMLRTSPAFLCVLDCLRRGRAWASFAISAATSCCFFYMGALLQRGRVGH